MYKAIVILIVAGFLRRIRAKCWNKLQIRWLIKGWIGWVNYTVRLIYLPFSIWPASLFTIIIRNIAKRFYQEIVILYNIDRVKRYHDNFCFQTKTALSLKLESCQILYDSYRTKIPYAQSKSDCTESEQVVSRDVTQWRSESVRATYCRWDAFRSRELQGVLARILESPR